MITCGPPTSKRNEAEIVFLYIHVSHSSNFSSHRLSGFLKIHQWYIQTGGEVWCFRCCSTTQELVGKTLIQTNTSVLFMVANTGLEDCARVGGEDSQTNSNLRPKEQFGRIACIPRANRGKKVRWARAYINCFGSPSATVRAPTHAQCS